MAMPNTAQPMHGGGCWGVNPTGAPISVSCAVLNSLFLSPLPQNPQYEFKDPAGNFTPSLTQPGAYYPYEPTLGQYQYDR